MKGFHVSASGAIHGHHGPLFFFFFFLFQSERKRSRDKESIEDDALRLKDSVAELTNENISIKKKL